MMTSDSTQWRPIAFITLVDPALRARLAAVLHRGGWAVVEQPTGLHLIHALSGLILGDQPWLRPGLVVADAAARGCSGLTIARGLRDLDWHIPVVVVARPADAPQPSHDGPVAIAAPDEAARIVERLVRAGRPADRGAA